MADLDTLERRLATLERWRLTLGLWQDWTPTVTQSGSVTVTVTRARYLRLGKLAVVVVNLAVTGTGTAGNAIVIGGQPAAIQAAAGQESIGVGVVFDATVGLYTGTLFRSGATDWRFIAHQGGNIGVDPNFALANGDSISFQGAYEVA